MSLKDNMKRFLKAFSAIELLGIITILAVVSASMAPIMTKKLETNSTSIGIRDGVSFCKTPIDHCSICFKEKCVKCNAGYYINDTDTCSPCSAGKYCSGASKKEIPCSPGTYSSVTSASCTKCPAGKYSGTGASSCSACDSGYFADKQGSSECTPCPAGTYATKDDINGTPACSVCADGTYSTGGASSCSSCPANHFSNLYTGKAQCEICPAGKSCNSTGVTGTCSAGQYSRAGEMSCSSCDAGTYSSTAGAATCTACAKGTYAALGATKCEQCPAGYKCSSSGYDAINDKCKASSETTSGEYSPVGDDSCKTCPSGSYAPQAGSATCTPCPAGYFCESGKSPSHSSKCGAGYYPVVLASGGHDCKKCDWNNGWVAAAGSTTCVKCPSGTVPALNHSTCMRCAVKGCLACVTDDANKCADNSCDEELGYIKNPINGICKKKTETASCPDGSIKIESGNFCITTFTPFSDQIDKEHAGFKFSIGNHSKVSGLKTIDQYVNYFPNVNDIDTTINTYRNAFTSHGTIHVDFNNEPVCWGGYGVTGDEDNVPYLTGEFNDPITYTCNGDGCKRLLCNFPAASFLCSRLQLGNVKGWSIPSIQELSQAFVGNGDNCTSSSPCNPIKLCSDINSTLSNVPNCPSTSNTVFNGTNGSRYQGWALSKCLGASNAHYVKPNADKTMAYCDPSNCDTDSHAYYTGLRNGGPFSKFFNGDGVFKQTGNCSDGKNSGMCVVHRDNDSIRAKTTAWNADQTLGIYTTAFCNPNAVHATATDNSSSYFINVNGSASEGNGNAISQHEFIGSRGMNRAFTFYCVKRL